MEKFYYLIVLLISLAGLFLADYRYRLAFRRNAGASVITIVLSVVFFIIWDSVGINLGVFHTNKLWVSGSYIVSRDFPVEELLFLVFLSYITLAAWNWKKIQ